MYDVVEACPVHPSEYVHYAWIPVITFKIGFHYTKGWELGKRHGFTFPWSLQKRVENTESK